MNIVMKHVCFFIITILIFASNIVNGYSIDIDGVNDGVEWDNSDVWLIFDGESNSRVNYASIKSKIISEENAVFLCFIFTDPFLEYGNVNAGISITTENSDCFEFTVTDSPYRSDTFDHSFDGAIFVDKNNGATCEIRLGFKNGMPETIRFDVRFIDSAGANSNKYPIIINNRSLEKTTVKTYYDYDEDYHNTRKCESTTKRYEDKTEFYIQTSPPYSYIRRTRAPKTTSLRATTEPTRSLTTKVKQTTVRHKNEMKSDITQNTSVTFLSLTSETTETTNTTIYETETLSTVRSEPKLTKGMKYKIIIGVFSAVSFTAIAVAASKSSVTSKPDDK